LGLRLDTNLFTVLVDRLGVALPAGVDHTLALAARNSADVRDRSAVAAKGGVLAFELGSTGNAFGDDAATAAFGIPRNVDAIEASSAGVVEALLTSAHTADSALPLHDTAGETAVGIRAGMRLG